MTSKISKIKRLTYDTDFIYFLQIANIHIARIHHGVLPLLGPSLLAKIYRQLTKDSNAGIWVVIEANQVDGFICSTTDTKSTFIKLLLSPHILFHSLLSGFYFSSHALKKIPALISYPFSGNKDPVKEEEKVSAELLSIAVSESKKGLGLGKLLVGQMEECFRQSNIKKYRVTTNVTEVVSNAFYSSLKFSVHKSIIHHDLTLQIYEKNILPKADL